jgi:phytoene/squalene synthetase
VRAADEIVDSFHGYPKKQLLADFKTDTYRAIEQKISLNPILNSFQQVVNQYQIPRNLIDSFLRSMEMDLYISDYDENQYQDYIWGSAEVVGLMCLKVFCQGDSAQYEQLAPAAAKLGSAFQKINFLRDLHSDFEVLGRSYFPDIDLDRFDEKCKQQIQQDLISDFDAGYQGIKQLPKSARFGVYVAYVYYRSLLKKICSLPHDRILHSRIRVPNIQKYLLFFTSYFKYRLNLI